MEYFISINNEKQGPYSIAELSARHLEATTLVLPAKGGTWTPAWQIEELRPILGIENNDVDLTSLNSEDSNAEPLQKEQKTEYVQAEPVFNSIPETGLCSTFTRRKKKVWGCLSAIFIAFIVLIAALFFTRPTAGEHKAVLTEVISDTMNDYSAQADSATHNDVFVQAFSQLFFNAIEKTIHAAVYNLVKVDDYGICTVGRIRWQGKNRIVSVGVLGHVYTLHKEDLKKIIEKNINSDSNSMINKGIKDVAKDFLNNGIIDPLSDAIKDMIGSAVDGMIDDGSSQPQPSAPILTDSI